MAQPKQNFNPGGLFNGRAGLIGLGLILMLGYGGYELRKMRQAYETYHVPDLINIPPKKLVTPLEDFFNQEEKIVFRPKVNPGLIGESHAGGSGTIGGNRKYPRSERLVNGNTNVTANFHVTLPDSVLQNEGNIEATFRLFSEDSEITPLGIQIKVNKSGNRVESFNGNQVTVLPDDFINSPDSDISHIEFEVTLDFSPTDSVYYIVKDIVDHHDDEQIEVEENEEGQIEVSIPDESMIPTQCLIQLNPLEKYRCLDNQIFLHISKHITIQEIKLED